MNKENKCTEQCYDDMTLADYMEGDLPDEENILIREHIKECDKCFSSLAFYFKSSKEMLRETELAPLPVEVERVEHEIAQESQKEVPAQKMPSVSLFEKISRFFENLQPFSNPAPVFALTILFIFSVVMLNKESKSGINIVRISETELLSFSDKESAPDRFSFAAGQRKELKKYSGVDITLGDSAILFTWKGLPETSEYNFIITDISKIRKKVYSSIVPLPEAKISGKLVQSGKRYRWNISGKTLEGRYFSAEGEFVQGGENF